MPWPPNACACTCAWGSPSDGSTDPAPLHRSVRGCRSGTRHPPHAAAPQQPPAALAGLGHCGPARPAAGAGRRTVVVGRLQQLAGRGAGTGPALPASRADAAGQRGQRLAARGWADRQPALAKPPHGGGGAEAGHRLAPAAPAAARAAPGPVACPVHQHRADRRARPQPHRTPAGTDPAAAAGCALPGGCAALGRPAAAADIGPGGPLPLRRPAPPADGGRRGRGRRPLQRPAAVAGCRPHGPGSHPAGPHHHPGARQQPAPADPGRPGPGAGHPGRH